MLSQEGWRAVPSFDFAPPGLRSGRTASVPFTLSVAQPKSLPHPGYEGRRAAHPLGLPSRHGSFAKTKNPGRRKRKIPSWEGWPKAGVGSWRTVPPKPTPPLCGTPPRRGWAGPGLCCHRTVVYSAGSPPIPNPQPPTPLSLDTPQPPQYRSAEISQPNTAV